MIRFNSSESFDGLEKLCIENAELTEKINSVASAKILNHKNIGSKDPLPMAEMGKEKVITVDRLNNAAMQFQTKEKRKKQARASSDRPEVRRQSVARSESRTQAVSDIEDSYTSKMVAEPKISMVTRHDTLPTSSVQFKSVQLPKTVKPTWNDIRHAELSSLKQTVSDLQSQVLELTALLKPVVVSHVVDRVLPVLAPVSNISELVLLSVACFEELSALDKHKREVKEFQARGVWTVCFDGIGASNQKKQWALNLLRVKLLPMKLGAYLKLEVPEVERQSVSVIVLRATEVVKKLEPCWSELFNERCPYVPTEAGMRWIRHVSCRLGFVNANGGWERDLTEEGIEANPGPFCTLLTPISPSVIDANFMTNAYNVIRIAVPQDVVIDDAVVSVALSDFNWGVGARMVTVIVKSTLDSMWPPQTGYLPLPPNIFSIHNTGTAPGNTTPFNYNQDNVSVPSTHSVIYSQIDAIPARATYPQALPDSSFTIHIPPFSTTGISSLEVFFYLGVSVPITNMSATVTLLSTLSYGDSVVSSTTGGTSDVNIVGGSCGVNVLGGNVGISGNVGIRSDMNTIQADPDSIFWINNHYTDPIIVSGAVLVTNGPMDLKCSITNVIPVPVTNVGQGNSSVAPVYVKLTNDANSLVPVSITGTLDCQVVNTEATPALVSVTNTSLSTTVNNPVETPVPITLTNPVINTHVTNASDTPVNVQVVNPASNPVNSMIHNTSASPVWIYGPVVVSNQTLQTSVNNTVAVNVSNTPSVSISNSPVVQLPIGTTVAVTNTVDSAGKAVPLLISGETETVITDVAITRQTTVLMTDTDGSTSTVIPVNIIGLSDLTAPLWTSPYDPGVPPLFIQPTGVTAVQPSPVPNMPPAPRLVGIEPNPGPSSLLLESSFARFKPTFHKIGHLETWYACNNNPEALALCNDYCALKEWPPLGSVQIQRRPNNPSSRRRTIQPEVEPSLATDDWQKSELSAFMEVPQTVLTKPLIQTPLDVDSGSVELIASVGAITRLSVLDQSLKASTMPQSTGASSGGEGGSGPKRGAKSQNENAVFKRLRAKAKAKAASLDVSEDVVCAASCLQWEDKDFARRFMLYVNTRKCFKLALITESLVDKPLLPRLIGLTLMDDNEFVDAPPIIAESRAVLQGPLRVMETITSTPSEVRASVVQVRAGIDQLANAMRESEIENLRSWVGNIKSELPQHMLRWVRTLTEDQLYITPEDPDEAIDVPPAPPLVGIEENPGPCFRAILLWLLRSSGCVGWLRDLTAEGIEPNPGPYPEMAVLPLGTDGTYDTTVVSNLPGLISVLSTPEPADYIDSEDAIVKCRLTVGNNGNSVATQSERTVGLTTTLSYQPFPNVPTQGYTPLNALTLQVLGAPLDNRSTAPLLVPVQQEDANYGLQVVTGVTAEAFISKYSSLELSSQPRADALYTPKSILLTDLSLAMTLPTSNVGFSTDMIALRMLIIKRALEVASGQALVGDLQLNYQVTGAASSIVSIIADPLVLTPYANAHYLDIIGQGCYPPAGGAPGFIPSPVALGGNDLFFSVVASLAEAQAIQAADLTHSYDILYLPSSILSVFPNALQALVMFLELISSSNQIPRMVQLQSATGETYRARANTESVYYDFGCRRVIVYVPLALGFNALPPTDATARRAVFNKTWQFGSSQTGNGYIDGAAAEAAIAANAPLIFNTVNGRSSYRLSSALHTFRTTYTSSSFHLFCKVVRRLLPLEENLRVYAELLNMECTVSVPPGIGAIDLTGLKPRLVHYDATVCATIHDLFVDGNIVNAIAPRFRVTKPDIGLLTNILLGIEQVSQDASPFVKYESPVSWLPGYARSRSILSAGLLEYSGVCAAFQTVHYMLGRDGTSIVNYANGLSVQVLDLRFATVMRDYDNSIYPPGSDYEQGSFIGWVESAVNKFTGGKLRTDAWHRTFLNRRLIDRSGDFNNTVDYIDVNSIFTAPQYIPTILNDSQMLLATRGYYVEIAPVPSYSPTAPSNSMMPVSPGNVLESTEAYLNSKVVMPANTVPQLLNTFLFDLFARSMGNETWCYVNGLAVFRARMFGLLNFLANPANLLVVYRNDTSVIIPNLFPLSTQSVPLLNLPAAVALRNYTYTNIPRKDDTSWFVTGVNNGGGALSTLAQVTDAQARTGYNLPTALFSRHVLQPMSILNTLGQVGPPVAIPSSRRIVGVSLAGASKLMADKMAAKDKSETSTGTADFTESK